MNDFSLNLFDENYEDCDENFEESLTISLNDETDEIIENTDISTSRAKIDRLLDAFTEASDIMGANTFDKATSEYIEECFDQFFENVFESGPIFESVERDDKEEVSAIIKKIRNPVREFFGKNNIQNIKPNMVGRILFGGSGYYDASVNKKTGQISSIADASGWWTRRLWQIVAVAYTDEETIGDAIEYLNEELADVLGDYKLCVNKCIPSLIDLFRVGFNWKNRHQAYWVVVDKTIKKSEFKKMDEEIVNALKKK